MSILPAAPTPAELQVLRVLWGRGASTVREVHEALYAGTAYTTTLKVLQNLHAKGLVARDERQRQRQHIYTAIAREDDTLQGVLRGLIDRAFDGSPAALAMHALEAKPATAAELAELKELIRRLERRGRQ